MALGAEADGEDLWMLDLGQCLSREHGRGDVRGRTTSGDSPDTEPDAPASQGAFPFALEVIDPSTRK